MRIAMLILLNLLIPLVSINTVFAGCADLGSATSWSLVDTHTIIFYRGRNAIALLKIPYCYIRPSSDIRLVKDYVCDWDKIIIDGEVCDIRKIEKLY